MTFDPANSIGPFLQTSTFFPDDFDEFRVKFLEVYRNIANATNTREVGIYDLVEFLSGEQWFTVGNAQKKRRTFRKVFSIGAIAAGATSLTAHGLTNVTSFTHIYGTAVTDAPDNRPLPYVSTVAVNQQISLRVTATDIEIINGAASANITSAIVVLEYLKN